MCRWLLHMRDFAGGDDLMLTQESSPKCWACGGRV